MTNPKKYKNIIFSPWGCENIQNDMAQLIRASKHPKCLFQLEWPKCPWSTLGWTKGQTRSKLSQNNIFRNFTSNPSSTENFYKFDPKSISGGPKNPNFDLAVKTGLNQCHCKDYQILIQTTIHGSKSKLERPRYHENWDDAPIDAPITSESHNFWSNRWIFKIHTFSKIGNQNLFGVP